MKINEIPEALCSSLRIKIISSLLTSSRSFTELLEITQATRGNLSVQLSKLEDWKYISSEKVILNKKTKTTYTITPFGFKQFEAYIMALQQILMSAQNSDS